MAGINLLHHFGGSDIIENGSQDVTGSAAALPDLPVKEVLLQADPNNVIDIYVGRDTVTVPGGAKPGIINRRNYAATDIDRPCNEHCSTSRNLAH